MAVQARARASRVLIDEAQAWSVQRPGDAPGVRNDLHVPVDEEHRRAIERFLA
jgi:hypothetical protein